MRTRRQMVVCGRTPQETERSNRPTVRARLRQHMADQDATMNDSTVADLYREDHGMAEGADTDLEFVEAWVQDMLS